MLHKKSKLYKILLRNNDMANAKHVESPIYSKISDEDIK